MLKNIGTHWVIFFQKLILLMVGSVVTLFLSNHIMSCATQPDFDVEKSTLLMKKLGISNLTTHEKALLVDVVFPEDVETAFDDIMGLDNQKVLLKQLVLHNHPDVDHVNGVVLHGLPGTGKTMLAKAIARETKSVFINFNITSIEDKFVGESNKRLDALFSLARKFPAAVVFMDELDGFGASRCALDQSHVTNLKTLLLQRMDGLSTNNTNGGRVIFIGATNNLSAIDAAIKRRMRLHIEIDLPDAITAEAIMKKRLKSNTIRVSDIAARCAVKKASGSDISQLCILAQYEAIKNARPKPIEADLEVGFNLLFPVPSKTTLGPSTP